MQQPTDMHHLLKIYLRHYPTEAESVARVRHLVEHHPDAFERTCRVGHITGSAWIVSADGDRALLTHHRKLNRWLQLGGHADGDRQPHRVALREAQEESGLIDFSFVGIEGWLLPFDIDVHPIPARGEMPQHDHHDLRYLLIAAAGQELRISDESNDLRWFTASELDALNLGESIQRMRRKAAQLLTA